MSLNSHPCDEPRPPPQTTGSLPFRPPLFGQGQDDVRTGRWLGSEGPLPRSLLELREVLSVPSAERERDPGPTEVPLVEPDPVSPVEEVQLPPLAQLPRRPVGYGAPLAPDHPVPGEEPLLLPGPVPREEVEGGTESVTEHLLYDVHEFQVCPSLELFVRGFGRTVSVWETEPLNGPLLRHTPSLNPRPTRFSPSGRGCGSRGT